MKIDPTNPGPALPHISLIYHCTSVWIGRPVGWNQAFIYLVSLCLMA